MKKNKLKKNMGFSLIILLIGCVGFYCINYFFNINGLINLKILDIKNKEMKLIYDQTDTLGDSYSEDSNKSVGRNISDKNDQLNYIDTGFMSTGNSSEYIFLQNKANKKTYVNNFKPNFNSKSVLNDLEKKVNSDSFRDKNLGLYYIFNFNYTMNAIKELDSSIETFADAQKIPKALVAAVIFREMMFLGQEDMLDGVPVIGGKSLGLCQIGVENVRKNEQIVHAAKSVINKQSDDDIMEKLKDPKQAIYFCAVQLRARAITLTNNKNVNFNSLSKNQILKVLEEYNQSNLPFTIGPIKTKAGYAEETYEYYELLTKYYQMKDATH